MNTGLSDRLKELEHSFSKGQKLIANFIENHYDKVAFMTAAKLGQSVGVSESTVVRFAMEVGYSGYSEFQQAIHDMARNKLDSVQKLKITSENFTLEDLLQASLSQDIDIIKKTKETVDEKEFYNAVDAISHSDSVYIIGAGSSIAPATFLAHYMSLIFDKVTLLDATSEEYMLRQLMHLKKGDTVIGISFPRYTKRAVKAMSYAKDKGATTVAITDNHFSPITEFSKHILTAMSDMVSFVDSIVGPLSLINALIVTIAIKRKTEVSSTLKRLEDIWDEYGVYEK